MLTIVEKVILLQEVDIFSEVSTEQLSHLATIVTEEQFAVDESIYREQDPSDAMFLVVEGRVRLHRGALDIEIAESGQPFGTWALFDEEPRVATATPLEDVQVLRLDKEDFIDLLADNVRITQGVLKTLVGNYRRLIGRIGGRNW